MTNRYQHSVDPNQILILKIGDLLFLMQKKLKIINVYYIGGSYSSQ